MHRDKKTVVKLLTGFGYATLLLTIGALCVVGTGTCWALAFLLSFLLEAGALAVADFCRID